MIRNIFAIIVVILLLGSCREDNVIYQPEPGKVTDPEFSSIRGFYLLNEGNMGSNKASLDYFDYEKGEYVRNIYSSINPDVPKELGDVGNDLQIYGSRMYAVINCSNKIEVMEASTAKRIGQIEIPNCRYIAFHDGYAYVTSYAGPVVIDPDYKQLGYVAKVDTATLQVVDKCTVGFQPDGLAVYDGKIYVCNSGGYMVPNYENTVSVIDIATFKETGRIPIAINLHRICADRQGKLWISSRGDYYDVNASLYCYDTHSGILAATLPVPVSDMDLAGDSLYIVSTQWSYETMSNKITNSIVNTSIMRQVSDNFIKDGTEKAIKIPYCVKVNPLTREIYVTDAGNYVNPGYIHCYSEEGIRKWSYRTGDIPAHIAFVGQKRHTDQK